MKFQTINQMTTPMTCPVCAGSSQKVNRKTVEHLVLSDVAEQLKADEYYLCLDPDCSVAYFSKDPEHYITCSQLKVPLWYKTGVDPKYACYCDKVTEEQVIEAIRQGAHDVAAINRATGAMKHSNCQLNNPTGKCCHPIIQQIIDRTLK